MSQAQLPLPMAESVKPYNTDRTVWGSEGGNLGDAFEVEIDEPDTNRHETLAVPSNKTLLDVLNEAGLDIVYSCKSGACGACKSKVCRLKYTL